MRQAAVDNQSDKYLLWHKSEVAMLQVAVDNQIDKYLLWHESAAEASDVTHTAQQHAPMTAHFR